MAPRGRFLNLLHETRRLPVLVDEADRLRGALLARERVRVLVRLPGHVLKVVDVRPQDLPVEARVLELDLAAEVERELLGHGLAPREERHLGVAPDEHVVEGRPRAVDQIQGVLREAARVAEPQKLLVDDLDALVDLHGALVAHPHRRERLEGGISRGKLNGVITDVAP